MSSPPKTTAQLQCLKQGGPLKVVQVPFPKPPTGDEVLIHQKVVALNLVDTKQRDYNVMNSPYPCVLGLEGGGVVEAVGDDVKGLQIGDEVAGWQWEAFQERVVAKEGLQFKKPKNLTLVEAASMPDCLVTAISAINAALNIPLPMFEGLPSKGSPPSSVLILGGASAVGANAVQLLRVAYPSLPILATASPKHHAHVYDLGASKVVDYKSATVVEDLKAASPKAAGIDIIIDCVSAGATQTDICDVLDPAGSRRYANVRTGVDVRVPDDVEQILASAEFTLDGPGGNTVVPALTKLVENGVYRMPLPVRIVGHGLETLPVVLDEVKKASCEKLVLTV